jgi:Rad3-related DNA helicase
LYEKTLRERKFRPVAMSVLASGAITPREAVDYVCGLPKVESIVFGASSRGNIRQTKQLIDEAWSAA